MKVTRADGMGGCVARLLPLLVVIALAGCGVRTPAADIYPELAPFAGLEIERLRFVAPEPFGGDTLADQIRTEPTHCRLVGLPFCLPGNIGLRRRVLRLETLHQDVQRLELFYRRAGFHNTLIRPVAEPLRLDRVSATFVVTLGTPIITEQLELVGLEGIIDPDSLMRRLPLQRGELFNLERFSASADTILRVLRRRGHAYAEVLRNYDIDAVGGRAIGSIEAVAGPVVTVDTLVVLGADRLSQTTVARQVGIAPADTLLVDRLVNAQRNLYNLDLVQFATVEIAHDTLQLDPLDRSRATIAVRISEAPPHRVDAALGFGTVECFRAEAEWVSRNFLGRARRLSLFGGASKIGIAGPIDVGFLCPEFRRPELDRLDYRLSADLTQPWFLGPRNSLTVSGFGERQSHPDIFQREAVGSRITVGRWLGPRETVTGMLNIERGRTIATPALLCAAFFVCLPEDIRQLGSPRWRNSIGVAWVRDRTDPIVDATQGHTLRSTLAWTPEFLGADVGFVRWTGEASAFRQIGPASVAAGFLRIGSLIGARVVAPDEILPPEERFYTGGAYSVRGFRRNELGPGVYVQDLPPGPPDDPPDGIAFDPDLVRFVPIGGQSLVVASAEARLPAPFMADLLRFALFLDAGAVGAGPIWDLRPADWRVTPGAGLRVRTPVGPIRMDVAYNPYPPPAGPLFLPDPETGALIRAEDDFRGAMPRFWQRFRLHLALGQAF